MNAQENRPADDLDSGTGSPGAPGRSHVPFVVTLVSLTILFGFGSVYALVKKDGHVLFKPTGFDFDALGILVAAGMTLTLYTFLYEDNPFFKAAEHLYVGIGLGYQIVVAWFEYIKPEAYKQLLKYALRPDTPGSPEWALVPAMVLSFLLLLRFIPSMSFLSRIPVAFIVGLTAATQATNFIQANVLKQVEDTITPLTLAGGPLALFGQLVILAGVVTVLMYFFFSVEHKGAFGLGSRIGVWFLMVAFGASFGYTVMGRMALIVKRLQFLIGDWLKIPLQ